MVAAVDGGRFEGELKRVLAQETGLAPSEQRLLFRGKEKDDGECLHMAGIKDMSKVVLLEDPASKEQKLERMKRDQGMLRACEAVAAVRAEVDKLAVKVGGSPIINCLPVVCELIELMCRFRIWRLLFMSEPKLQIRNFLF